MSMLGATKLDAAFFYDLRHKSSLEIIKFCQDLGLLATSLLCPKCDEHMKLVKYTTVLDGYIFLCRIEGEDPHNVKKSVRTGSWFNQFKISLAQALLMTYMWVEKYPQYIMKKEFLLSGKSARDWSMYCRELCGIVLFRDNCKIGGSGTSVQIDVAKYEEMKYHQGHYQAGQWVFGGVCSTSNKCFLVVTQENNIEILLAIIKDKILPGSIVYSECWDNYDCSSNDGFQELIVNQAMQFKETTLSNDVFKEMKIAVKEKLKKRHKNVNLFDSFMQAHMYRLMKFSTDISNVTVFFDDIKSIYAPQKVEDT